MLDMERTEVVVLVVVLVAEDLLLPRVPEELSMRTTSIGNSSEPLRPRNVLLRPGAEEVAVAVADLVLGPIRSGPSGTWSELGLCDG